MRLGGVRAVLGVVMVALGVVLKLFGLIGSCPGRVEEPGCKSEIPGPLGPRPPINHATVGHQATLYRLASPGTVYHAGVSLYIV